MVMMLLSHVTAPSFILLIFFTMLMAEHGWKTEVLDTSYAEEAGLKSATFKVEHVRTAPCAASTGCTGV